MQARVPAPVGSTRTHPAVVLEHAGGNSEVDDFGHGGAVDGPDQDIGGFEVTVNHAPAVRVFHLRRPARAGCRLCRSYAGCCARGRQALAHGAQSGSGGIKRFVALGEAEPQNPFVASAGVEHRSSVLPAMRSLSAGNPGMGAYWLWPAAMAPATSSRRRAGHSKSGNPCDRLMAPWRTAICDITAKMVVLTLGSRDCAARRPAGFMTDQPELRKNQRNACGVNSVRCRL